MTTAPPEPSPADDPWRGMNLLDPEARERFRADPFPALRRLAESDPVNETPIGIWRLSRHGDCLRLLRDPRAGVRRSDGRLFGAEALDFDRPGNFMLQQDPPAHTRLRKLVSKAFTPRATERLRPRVEAIAEAAMDAACERGEMDVIRDLALPVPATMICEMMGVPIAYRDRFTQWTAEATHVLAALTSPPDVVERARNAGVALGEYFDALVAERRKDLRDDILSDLIRARDEEEKLSPDELAAQCVGLLIAGFETTIGLIGNGILALLRHPDELARLRANPDGIDAAVEECLRYDGPIPLTVRIAHEDLEIGGRTIPKDTMVWAMLASANRDPAVFPDPERFDIARDPNPHLAFGGGAHLCLGSHLARLEGRVAIGAFVRRAHRPELSRGELEWGRSLFRVLARLPVAFGG